MIERKVLIFYLLALSFSLVGLPVFKLGGNKSDGQSRRRSSLPPVVNVVLSLSRKEQDKIIGMQRSPRAVVSCRSSMYNSRRNGSGLQVSRDVEGLQKMRIDTSRAKGWVREVRNALADQAARVRREMVVFEELTDRFVEELRAIDRDLDNRRTDKNRGLCRGRSFRRVEFPRLR